jgi:hypothetical protein
MVKYFQGFYTKIKGRIFPKIITWAEVREEIFNAIEENERKQRGKEKDGGSQNTF